MRFPFSKICLSKSRHRLTVFTVNTVIVHLFPLSTVKETDP